jgi:hypothetical protein
LVVYCVLVDVVERVFVVLTVAVAVSFTVAVLETIFVVLTVSVTVRVLVC